MRRKFKRRAKFKLNLPLKKTLQTIILLCFFCLLVLGIYTLLLVKNINCHIQQETCPQHIQIELQKLKGKLIFYLPVENIKQKISGFDPTVASIDYSFRIPSTVNVNLNLAQPIAQIAVSSSSASYIVSSNYKVTALTSSPSANFPYLISSHASKLNIGDSIINTPIANYIDTAIQLNQNYIPYKYIDATNPNKTTIFLSDSTVAYIDTTQDLKPQITRLQLVINQLQLSSLSSIDVRIEKPIIVGNVTDKTP